MPQVRGSVIFLPLLLMFLALHGCGDANPNAVFDPDNPDASHPEGWLDTHRAFFISAPVSCTGCHGKDLQGGISFITCFSSGVDGTACHGPSHQAGWRTPGEHGATAKARPESLVGGFGPCQLCHGSDFAGGFTEISCFAGECHGVSAPHPPEPWLFSPLAHIDTDTQNAGVCARCHLGESGVSVPAGTPPDCFNNTLCHGSSL